MRFLTSICLSLCLIFAAAQVEAAGKNPVVRMTTTMGDIFIELDAEKAPITSANFETYVRDGFFDGLIFHRVIKNFMVQGGGFDQDMNQKNSRASIKNEADNGLKNDKYTLAMARTQDPQSASSQFFINTKDNAFLNYSAPTMNGWGYAVFGKVIDGFNVVDAMNRVSTGFRGPHGDVPTEAIIITKAEMVD